MTKSALISRNTMRVLKQLCDQTVRNGMQGKLKPLRERVALLEEIERRRMKAIRGGIFKSGGSFEDDIRELFGPVGDEVLRDLKDRNDGNVRGATGLPERERVILKHSATRVTDHVSSGDGAREVPDPQQVRDDCIVRAALRDYAQKCAKNHAWDSLVQVSHILRTKYGEGTVSEAD